MSEEKVGRLRHVGVLLRVEASIRVDLEANVRLPLGRVCLCRGWMSAATQKCAVGSLTMPALGIPPQPGDKA